MDNNNNNEKFGVLITLVVCSALIGLFNMCYMTSVRSDIKGIYDKIDAIPKPVTEYEYIEPQPQQQTQTQQPNFIDPDRVQGNVADIFEEETQDNVIGIYARDTDDSVYIVEVAEDLGADKAGVLSGDVIIEVDDQPIHCIQDIKDILATFDKGDFVKVKIIRQQDGERFNKIFSIQIS